MESKRVRNRRRALIGVLLGVLVALSARAQPVPLVRRQAQRTPDAAASSMQMVGNGVYPASTSACYPYPTQWNQVPMTYHTLALTAANVVGVYWPGAQPPDLRVHTLFPDFVTDLFNGPYWNALMPQYVGSAPCAYQSSVDMPVLLTHPQASTVRVRDITGELLAQIHAHVLPKPNAQGTTLYVVHMPPGVTVADSNYNYVDHGVPTTHHSIGTSCVDFCAYHDHYVSDAVDTVFTFAVIPDFSQNGGCSGGCGAGTTFDVYTEVLSHELVETITRPYGAGWYNSCSQRDEEIADVCQAWGFYTPRRTSTPGTPQCPNRWGVASMFSNANWVPATASGCLVTDAIEPGTCTADVVPARPLAATLEFAAPQPNPSVAGTRLRYTLPFASAVRLTVTDVAGRQVAVLARRFDGPGGHDATWNGRDAAGRRVGAGLYFVRLEAAGQALSRKLTIAD